MSEAKRRPLGAAGNNLRRNLRRLREQRGWGYADVTKQLSGLGRAIHTDQLSAIDAGERHVNVDELVALAAVYGFSPEELLQPPVGCDTCHGSPPAGYMCLECETSGLHA